MTNEKIILLTILTGILFGSLFLVEKNYIFTRNNKINKIHYLCLMSFLTSCVLLGYIFLKGEKFELPNIDKKYIILNIAIYISCILLLYYVMERCSPGEFATISTVSELLFVWLISYLIGYNKITKNVALGILLTIAGVYLIHRKN